MKKACFVLVFLMPFVAVMAAQMPTVAFNSNLEVLYPMDWSNFEMMPEEVVLAEDEGTPYEGAFLMPLFEVGAQLAVELTPPSYPFELLAVANVPLVWALDTVWDIPFDVVIYTSSFIGGPGSELGRKTVTPTAYSEFNWYDVSDLDITINSGSFFFSIECISKSTPEDVPAYPTTWPDHMEPDHYASWGYISLIHPDSTEPFHDWIAFQYLGGGATWPPGTAIGDSIDLILRAGGNAEGIGEVVLGPQGVISITPEKALISASENTVDYTIPEAGNAEITLWDGAGRKIRTLYEGHAEAGEHTLRWDSADLPKGTYFIYLSSRSLARTARVVLVD